MRGADYIVKRLVDEGFGDVFLVTGGGAMHLNDAFARNQNLKVTCFHHEQAAAIAAESYARTSLNPCALNVTSGPGGINAMVGVYGAYVDSIPMFVVSGQVKVETLAASYPHIPMRQLGDQEVDIASMVRPIVKYVKTIKTSLEVEEVVERALFLMKYGRPGPVWIDVPVDIQGSKMPSLKLNKFNPIELPKIITQDSGVTSNTSLELNELNHSRITSKNLCLDVIGKLKSAKRPVILAGTGISGVVEKKMFREWIELFDIPVVPGWNAMDLIASGHKNFAGRPGTVGDRAGNFAIQNADFILIIGCRLNIRQISYNWKSFGKNAFKVMIDVDRAELDKPTLNIDVKIHAAAGDFLKIALDEPIKNENLEHIKYRNWCKNNIEKFPVVQNLYKNTKLLNPYYFLHELSRLLPEDACVVAGNGAACVMTFQAFVVKNNQRIFTNSGCASMGYDLPASIGASIARKGRVYCIAGDGSIMMNIQELQTIISNKYPIKILLINNGGYLSIRLTQEAYFPDNLFGTDGQNGLEVPEFEKIAKGFGFQYAAIRNIDDISSLRIQKLLNSSGPAFIEVFVDPTQGFLPKLASRKNEDGSMTSPELEDMAPFLTREELNKHMLK